MNNENMGIDQQPISQNADSERLAEYYALNQEPIAEGTESGTPIADKASPSVDKLDGTPALDAKEPATADSTPDGKDRVPHWKKQIDKQTRRIRELEETIRATEERKSKVKAEPQYTQEHFVNERDFRLWEQKQIAREAALEASLENQQSELDHVTQSSNDLAFQSEWAERMKSNFEGDPDGEAEFRKNLNGTEVVLHPDVTKYIEATDYGPRMLQVLLLRPDLVEKFNRADPVVRPALMMKLDREIESHMKGSAQPAQPQQQARKVTNAPTPLNPIGSVGGSILSDAESDEVARQKYEKKYFGRK